jgi:carbamoyl-phosphate synthase small subunit
MDHLDTRDVVTTVREEGAMRCGVAVGPDVTPEDAREELAACVGMSEHTDIGKRVSVDEPVTYEGGGRCDVALVDCGAKGSIRDSLLERGADVHVLPYDVTPETVASYDPDVVFVSNGPGDPENFEAARDLVETFAGERPVAGICLGQQVVALALGGDTEKMRFGHRGVNQPVRDVETGKVVMTTQNHGYSVADPGELDVTQVNVNDGTAEGLADDERGVLTRQYHPEAHPGPHDSLGFFDDVLALAGVDASSAAEPASSD